MVNATAPSSFYNIFVFLSLLFVALSFTFSIPIYFFLYKMAPSFTNLKILYRRALRWGTFFSFGVIGTLGLKAFNLINMLNYGLFLILYISVFFSIKGRR